jgi:predicted O-methyltransferase YrrM
MKQFFKYINYLFSAKTKHGIHSPFVYDFVTTVLNDKKNYPDYDRIKNLRKQLLQNKTTINVTDLGAGSKTNKSNQRTISKICSTAEKNKKQAQLLYRIAAKYKPNVIFELGTSLGVTSLYLAAANKNTNLITIEGCPETATVARDNFKKQNAQNIKLVHGNFDDVLDPELQNYFNTITDKENHTALFFVDGNHRKEPTLNYFNTCLQYANANTIFIFDDINWSDEMREAWIDIINQEQVTVSIDLFFMGIVFLRNQQAKENFVLKF